MQSKYGFTLAEVLITLAVIGVVAAMMLPALVNNQKKKPNRWGHDVFTFHKLCRTENSFLWDTLNQIIRKRKAGAL